MKLFLARDSRSHFYAGRRRGGPAVFAVFPLVVVASLAGCSFVQEKASEAVCAAITPVTDTINVQLDDAVAQIAVNPDGAVDQITSLRDSLASASEAVGSLGSLDATLDALTGALDDVLALAEKAASGAEVTPEETQAVEDRVNGAVESVTGECS